MTYLGLGLRLFSLDIFFGRVLNDARVRIRDGQYTGVRRTGTGAEVSTVFSGEGSTAGVTSVGFSSDLGTAGTVVGSDIMLWEGRVEHGNGEGEVRLKETYKYRY